MVRGKERTQISGPGARISLFVCVCVCVSGKIGQKFMIPPLFKRSPSSPRCLTRANGTVNQQQTRHISLPPSGSGNQTKHSLWT